ncbi:hypothetical protein ACP70R_003063 [Stipagrostis hirtigluma subsp. patula]
MEHRRSGSMDFSLSTIHSAASVENTSDDKVEIIIPQMSPILPKSPSNRILPLRLQNEESHPAPIFAERAALRLVKKVVAEFLGTFMLIFIVLSTIIINDTRGGALGLLGVAMTAGLAVVVIVASLIHVSGSHLNPAVTVAMTVFGYLPRSHLVPYMVAQILGSVTASFAAKAIYDAPNVGAAVATVPALGTLQTFFVEFITTFVLLFVITALATDPRAVKELVAVVAGAALMMNILMSAQTTGASMNPVRTLGPALVTGIYTKIWIYMVAPTLGAIAGTGAYIAVK